MEEAEGEEGGDSGVAGKGGRRPICLPNGRGGEGEGILFYGC